MVATLPRCRSARAMPVALALLLALAPAVSGCGRAPGTGAPARKPQSPHPGGPSAQSVAPATAQPVKAAAPAPRPSETVAPARRPSESVAPAARRPAPAGAYPPPATPLAVVVGNDPGARPQSGLSRADVVWEILAEGGITRFFAVYASQGAARIGPVRSARIYFDQLDRAYGIPFAHAGGNVDALDWISTWHLASLDEIYGAGGFFWRGTRRVPPDNLYTSTSLLSRGIAALHLRGRGMTYPASGGAPPAGRPTASVRLRYWHAADYTYTVSWRWQGGWWRRYVDGAPVATAAGRPLRAGTVIVLAVAQAPDPDPHTPGALKLLWNRGGAAWTLRDGRRYRGGWQLGPNGLPAVRSPAGDPLPAGQRRPYWYEVVPTAGAVSFE